MFSFSNQINGLLFCFSFIAVGLSSLCAANEEDFGSRTYFPRSYGKLKEKSVYHQNRVSSMKGDLNDYGSRVYDLRQRFDRIFKNRETYLPAPTPFEIGQTVTWKDRRQGAGFTYQSPDSPHRLRPTEPRSRGPVTYPNQFSEDTPNPPSNLEANDEISPLAFVVEGPTQAPQPQEKKTPQRGAFEYYILPRLGMSMPTESGYDAGLAFATSAGIVRGDWRFGADFSYASNTFDTTISSIPLTGESNVYSIMVGVARDMPLGAGWTGSAGLSIGGGWSSSEKILNLNSPKVMKEGGFAWQLGLGARRDFGEITSLYLGYRYLGHPTLSYHTLEAGAEVGF